MSKFSPYGKITFFLFLVLAVLLVFSSMGSSPPHPVWGQSPSLQAVLSSEDGEIELSWQPLPGAAAYLIFRAPLAEVPYKFSLLQEVPGSQTFFSDDPGKSGSFIYKVAAVGAGDYVYPAAARLTIEAFGGLVPVSLHMHPNTVDNALSSLGSYDTVKDANTGEYLGGSSETRAGMVLEVAGAANKTLYMAGTVPAMSLCKFAPHKYKLFAVPLTYDPLHIKDLQVFGLKGSTSHSHVYSDGNNRQIPDTAPLLPGRVYGMRIDRETEIDFAAGKISQGGPVARPQVSRPQLLGGSPDDGTLVVVLYDDSYQTKLYKCWSSGKSGAWDGITDNATGADNVKNAAVVRRGRTMYVKDEAGMSDTTPVTVLAPSEPGNPRQTLGWSVSWNSGLGAAAVQIPAAAKVGDYQVRVGSDPENYVTVYIIFDPSYASSYLDANEYGSWAYEDDDWQSVADLKNYLNYVFEGPGYPLGSYPYVYGYRGDSNAESGADGGTFGQRHVEMACTIHGAGAADTFEAALHAYQVIGQRVSWVSGNGWYGNDGGEYNTFDDTLIGYIKAPSGIETATELDVVTGERAALGLGWTDRMSSAYVIDAGACFNYGTCLCAMIRCLGIPARCHHGIGSGGWTSSFHVWAEAFLDFPDIHSHDPNWWDSCWYEFDANNPYTGHSTSHQEGNITPIVIAGYGDYLVNEYINCEGIGYDGSFYDNSFQCTPPGSNTGTYTVVPKEIGTTDDAEDGDSYPLVITYGNSNSAWKLMDVFVPWNGPARPSGDANVYDGHHGYALNDTQTGPDGGAGYIDNATNEDDLPVLMYGVDQKGVVAGWGWMMYRVPVEGRDTITVNIVEGADKVEVLGTLDRNLYSTYKRWDLDYDFASDAGGTLTANTSGGDQLYLWVQLKNISVSSPGNGQEVGLYTIRVGDAGPYINASFTYTKLSDYEVQFTDTSTVYNDTIASWEWDFGDGNTSTEQNPTHTYSSAAYYDVTLTVTGASSAEDYDTQSIWIGPNQAPTADFSYTTLGGNAVAFMDLSTDSDGTVVGWSWDFGDGGNSTDQNPTHTYASPGTYFVTLTATDDDGAADSITKDVSVILQYCSSSSSSDSFHITRLDMGSFSNSSGGSTYSDFSDLIIYVDPGGSYSTSVIVNDNFWTGYTRIWIDYNRDGDFTDPNELVFQRAQSGGTISDTIDIPSSGVVTGLKLGFRVHTDTLNYKEPCDTGSGWGEVEDYSLIITGGGGNIAPHADFTYTTDELTANFTDTSTDSDGTIVSWDWAFGDGGTSTEQNPSHTYAAEGTYNASLTVTDNGGLSDTIYKDVTVTPGGNNLPTADFSYTTDGSIAILSDASSDSDGTVEQWSWDFGDGTTSTAVDVAHTYTSAGTYTVTLTVTDNDNGTDFTSQNVTVGSTDTAPDSEFSFVVDVANVTFTDESRDPDPDGSITGWSWDFGDGNTSTEQNPVHTYAEEGTYNVQLTVTDDDSNTDLFQQPVIVTGGNLTPTADFTFTSDDLTADFTDTSSDPDGSIVSWDWNFGDGGSSTAQNPSHTYTEAGTYDVTLTVTDDGDATDAITKPVTVTGPNNPPTADFTFTTTDLTADFTDASTDSDGTIASWSWDFGDGGTSTAQNPSHTYANAGTYDVELTVTDNEGASDSITKPVTVTAPNNPPTADFTYSATGLTADFTDASSDSDGSIVSWSWTFGDGGTSTAQNPSHTYANAGTYDVELTVTDNDGATDSITKPVTVTATQNDPPTANFTFTTNDLTADFTDTSTDPDGTVVAWSWTFGDGGTSTAQNPSHTYAQAGTYSVTLTVTDDDDASDDITKDVTVTAGGGVPDYCDSSSSSANPMAIIRVEMTDNALDNSSGKSTYSDFTNITANLEAGQTYSIRITLDSSFYKAYTRVWIDFNRDGDFEDSGEQVVQKAQKGQVVASFTLPAGAVTGQKLGMRIHSDTMSYRGPCSVGWGWGEVEDYAVLIQ